MHYFEKSKKMKPNELCNSCQLQLSLPSVLNPNTHPSSIWGFPFMQYTEYDVMKTALQQHYSEWLELPDKRPDEYWRCHNVEGYTFTQWNIYYLSKKYFRFKNFRGIVFSLFNALHTLPFFVDLLLTGTLSDPLHTTIHHYLNHMESGMNSMQFRMYRFLVETVTHAERANVLLQADQNGNGMNIHNYLEKLILPEAVLKQCRQLTDQYKKSENTLFARLQFLRKCTRCQCYLQPYEDLVENSQHLFEFLDLHPDWNDRLCTMLEQREQCNRLYESVIRVERTIDQKCVERHDYVIDVYRKLFDW